MSFAGIGVSPLLIDYRGEDDRNHGFASLGTLRNGNGLRCRRCGAYSFREGAPGYEVYYSFKIIGQVDFDDDYIGSCLCHLGLRNWLPNHICRLTLADSSMEHRSHQRVADHPPGKPRLRKRPDENVRRPDRWCRASANSMFRPVER